MSTPETICGYSFQPADLKVDDRRPGVSGFMRIKNGEEYLEDTIRSHVDFFDEIVAVYNQCTDATEDILLSLQNEFGRDKIRVIEYTDPVHPPGSELHAATSPESPNSLVNYYNFSLAATRCTHATKLDDDHIAIVDSTRAITDAIRAGETSPDEMLCFSGLNLIRRPDNSIGVLAKAPISGNGDIGFFRVTPKTHFFHDHRFERFHRGGAKRRFVGFLYWHLKFLKDEMGFANYELDKNPSSRYAKRKAAFENSEMRVFDLPELIASKKPGLLDRLLKLTSSKHAYMYLRNGSLPIAFPDLTTDQAITRTVDKEIAEKLFETHSA